MFPELSDVLLNFESMIYADDEAYVAQLCSECSRYLARGKTPPLSLANHNLLGDVPSELKELTPVEEAMVSKCRVKAWIVQLRERTDGDALTNSQRGMKAHVMVFPQRPEQLETLLSPLLNNVSTAICVLFIGSKLPSANYLRTHATPLIVHREKVHNALLWLKANNLLYRDVSLNDEVLGSLGDEQMLPVHVEHVAVDQASDLLTSRYDVLSQEVPNENNHEDVAFEGVVISDVDQNATAKEQKIAALRHLRSKGGAYPSVPHGSHPVNEFNNPFLFPSIYPTLFPYGLGGFDHPKRQTWLSMQRQVKHLLCLNNQRFQEHYSFMFSAFNILQRRTALLHTSLKVKCQSFGQTAEDFSRITSGTIHTVTEWVASGNHSMTFTMEEMRVKRLLESVNSIARHVDGSAASCTMMRNEIRGLMIDCGCPSFYVTVNPVDVYNPVVKFMGGADVDLDNLTVGDIPRFWEQSNLIARNSVLGATFFDVILRAFLQHILSWDFTDHAKSTEGALGRVKAYYGCVEAQGRGSLHCHMLIWLHGGLNPNEIQERISNGESGNFSRRLLAFLDDTISSSVPADPDEQLEVPSSQHHPCTVRGVFSSASDFESVSVARQKDMHHLVQACQVHKHTHTCYKYWRGPPDPRECWFGLDVSRFRPESSVDEESGGLHLRCLDGMVNNFNTTMLEALRCNMDIKFIGSGSAAKAILYYITDYITKSQLKTHVVYAALNLAVQRLEEVEIEKDDSRTRAKRLLQKCAYSMLSHQELSAPQVASYLLGLGDHYTSHDYAYLYWTSVEHCEHFASKPRMLSDRKQASSWTRT